MVNPKGTSTTRDVFALFGKQLQKHWLATSLAVLSIIAFSSLEAATPWFYKLLIDAIATSDGVRAELVPHLMGILISIVLLTIGTQITVRMADGINIVLASRIMTDLTNSSFSYLMNHSYQFFTNNFSGALIKKIQRLARAFEDISDQFVYSILQIVFLSTITMVVLFHRSTLIGTIMLVWMTLFILLNIALSRWIRKTEVARSEKESEATGLLSDAVTNSVNIKLFNGFAFEEGIIKKVMEELRRFRLRVWARFSVGSTIQMFCMSVVEIVTVYVAILLWAKGTFTIGDFVLVQGYLVLLMGRLWNISNVFRHVNSSIADAKEMLDILNLPYEIKDTKSAKALKIKKGEIEFNNVDFYYRETRPVLNGFNLTVAAHEKVALVGPSGAGKSTVVKVLFRFYDLGKGKIKIDGQNIATVTQESLRESIAMVPQEPVLFHRSLIENIRYGRRDATDEEVYAAAKKAHAHEFIGAFPEGYQTLVGERGVKLSGGERQRIAIARAILKNAPILVLDEATSSLDSESEALIQDALHELMKDKTVIVIAHRLSTIMEMDRIVVMEQGKVTDTGTHAALLKRIGTYKKLWEIQAGGFIP